MKISYYVKTVLLLIFCFIYFSCFSQNTIQGTLFYEISLIKPKINFKNTTAKQNYNKIKKHIENSHKIIGILKFNTYKSVYYVDKKLENDSDKKINLTEIFAGKNETYYHNINQGTQLLRKRDMGDVFLIKKEPLKWIITQENKKIGNYTCFKAIVKDTLNQKTFAWFTPKIPVNFGPKNYSGLPGMVLKIITPSLKYEATKVILNPKKEIKIRELQKKKIISEKEYKKLLKQYYPNFFKKKKE